ncbi:RNA polymerase sigma factor RpoE [Enhygromyxa salina]|uniref:RNA polymerase sigma factor RpoE n=1 Tax=Enhygromyxa salina TaxID=215803 RepID=A0A0C1Z534_9BACT|nr:sigma-70 family RNA polymerase sigma factor [Enhygromyxa salina]KIG12724.1 RNA polymerase sigma factor RpoE [Enhygromyxa salina]
MYAQVNADSRTDEPAGDAAPPEAAAPESVEPANPAQAPAATPQTKRRFRGKPESEEARAARDARDRRLVRRLKQGDERAFQELVQTYQDRIFGLVFRMIGNRQEAEDIAQEVFISVHRGIANYRGEGRFYTWLYRIASNTCKNRIKYLKGRNFHRASDIDETPAAHTRGEDGGPIVALQSAVPGPEATMTANRLERAIQAEIAQLEPEHRLLIVLRDIQGLTYAEILNITGLQEGTLKSRLHRARLALKIRLQPYLE